MRILWTSCILYTVMGAVTKVYEDFMDILYAVYCDVLSNKTYMGILWTPCILYTVMCAVTKRIWGFYGHLVYCILWWAQLQNVCGDFMDTLYTAYYDVRSNKTYMGILWTSCILYTVMCSVTKHIWRFYGHLVYCILWCEQ